MPPGQLGIIPMNSTGFTPILSSISCPVEFQIRPGMKYWPVEFDQARNTAQNGSKFTGITFVCLPGRLGIIPMNSTGFTPNSTGQIRPGMKYCSKWE